MKHFAIGIALLLTSAIYAQEVDTLNTVIVKSSGSRGIKKSLSLTANTQVMTSKELLKAACCNLAESFETNPSIDVNFSDALTGTKQIRMLGLTSPYLLIAEENIPTVRGASQAYGLSFTPGTWIESIQITKGAGSVINGFESISGQINTELLKPAGDRPLFFNVYGSTDARFEVNAHFNRHFSDKWASTLFIHGNSRNSDSDMNHDGFMDNPLGSQVNLLNRWQYTDAENGIVFFLNLKFMDDKKQTGQVGFRPDLHRGTTDFWGSEIDTRRIDVSTKLGYLFKDMPYQSIGWQNAYTHHNQDSYFGLREYGIRQDSYYSNLIFNSIISNTMNKFATGLNFTYDRYWEDLSDATTTADFSRIDNSIGAFFEYTYDNMGDFSLVAGLRADQHNRMGFFLTPRLHMRYNPWEDAVLRASVGRGKRAANVFAENQHLFASNRQLIIQPNGGDFYGLKPEIAWNYGMSFLQNFHVFNRRADFGVDFYRTDFQNQVVVDLYQGTQVANFYNLEGDSFANSLQVDFGVSPLEHVNLRFAYKWYDIQTEYQSVGSKQRPLQASNRFFVNGEYSTHMKDNGARWKFDATWNWTGTQYLPTVDAVHASHGWGEKAPEFSTLHAQITKVFSPAFEVYVGGENIGNYRQKSAILGAENPFGTDFDASMIYAPVFGQMYYAGLRIKLDQLK